MTDDEQLEITFAALAEWDDYKQETRDTSLAYVNAIVTKDVFDEIIKFIIDDDEGEGSFQVYSITDSPKGDFKLVDDIDDYNFKYIKWLTNCVAVGCTGDSFSGDIYIRINSYQSLHITFNY